MQMSPITSRPVYGRLAPWVRATRHIVVTEGPALGVFEAAFAGMAEVLARTTLIHIAGRADASDVLGADAVHVLPTRETALVRLKAVLAGADMGSRLYVCGDEDLIGRVQAVALAAGMMDEVIRAEHRGAPARRVQCVHCKGFTDDVVASPVTCRHCGTHLLVRDHYSRRLGAFMGVVIDAEAPGMTPPPEALPLPPVRGEVWP